MTEPSHNIARKFMISQVLMSNPPERTLKSVAAVAQPCLQLLQTGSHSGIPLKIPVKRATYEASKTRGTHSGRKKLAATVAPANKGARAGGIRSTAANAQRVLACRLAFQPASSVGHGMTASLRSLLAP